MMKFEGSIRYESHTRGDVEVGLTFKKASTEKWIRLWLPEEVGYRKDLTIIEGITLQLYMKKMIKRPSGKDIG